MRDSLLSLRAEAAARPDAGASWQAWALVLRLREGEQLTADESAMFALWMERAPERELDDLIDQLDADVTP